MGISKFRAPSNDPMRMTKIAEIRMPILPSYPFCAGQSGCGTSVGGASVAAAVAERIIEVACRRTICGTPSTAAIAFGEAGDSELDIGCSDQGTLQDNAVAVKAMLSEAYVSRVCYRKLSVMTDRMPNVKYKRAKDMLYKTDGTQWMHQSE